MSEQQIKNASQQNAGSGEIRVHADRQRDRGGGDGGGSADVTATDSTQKNAIIYEFGPKFENPNRMSIFIVIISFNDRWLTLWLWLQFIQHWFMDGNDEGMHVQGTSSLCGTFILHFTRKFYCPRWQWRARILSQGLGHLHKYLYGNKNPEIIDIYFDLALSIHFHSEFGNGKMGFMASILK